MRPYLIQASRHGGAGLIARAAADLDLAPAGFSPQRHEHAFVEKLDPTGPVAMLVADNVEADDLGATQTARKTQEQDGAVAQPPEIMAQCRDHGEKIVGEHRLLLARRLCVLAADAGEHDGDVAVFPIHRQAALGKIPPQSRQAPLDGGDGKRFNAALRITGGAGADVESDFLHLRGQRLKAVAPAPGQIVRKILGVGGLGILRAAALA